MKKTMIQLGEEGSQETEMGDGGGMTLGPSGGAVLVGLLQVSRLVRLGAHLSEWPWGVEAGSLPG